MHDATLLELLPLIGRREFVTRADLERRARARLRIPRREAIERVARAVREGLLEADSHGGLHPVYRAHLELLAP